MKGKFFHLSDCGLIEGLEAFKIDRQRGHLLIIKAAGDEPHHLMVDLAGLVGVKNADEGCRIKPLNGRNPLVFSALVVAGDALASEVFAIAQIGFCHNVIQFLDRTSRRKKNCGSKQGSQKNGDFLHGFVVALFFEVLWIA